MLFIQIFFLFFLFFLRKNSFNFSYSYDVIKLCGAGVSEEIRPDSDASIPCLQVKVSVFLLLQLSSDQW
jgi:hypothetical protein